MYIYLVCNHLFCSMAHIVGKIVSPYGTILRGINSKIPIFRNPTNYLCAEFKNCVALFYLIAFLKYIVPGSDTSALEYIFFLIGIIMFIAMIYNRTILTEEYFCACVGNICTRFDLVLCLVWLASMCF